MINIVSLTQSGSRTCSESSKSWPASRFISETFPSKRRILLPNEETSRKLVQGEWDWQNFMWSDTYCSSNTWTLSAPHAWSIRMRCVNNAFHTPSSTSCKRSTVSIPWKSKLNGERATENAFCEDGLEMQEQGKCGRRYLCRDKGFILQKAINMVSSNSIAFIV
jgi:hypothetical protein